VIVCYMAHPVRGDVAGNIAKAKRWLSWLQRVSDGLDERRAFVAPWIDWTDLGIDDDSDEKQRARALARDVAIVKRCDEIWLVGPRMSEGMKIEMDAAKSSGVIVRAALLGKSDPPERPERSENDGEEWTI